jgi:pyrimidine-nucleoside phosphorylase
MLPQELIEKKRDGGTLSTSEMREFFSAYLDGEIPEYQMSALIMAVYFRGMTFDETVALTDLFINSGKRVDLSAIPAVKVDKHSTGGVGDKTSLLLGPMVAATGIAVPMITGRGLGHTGGTLDKLESIPGFVATPDERSFRRQLETIGLALIGQTEEIVPLDKRIYALRDVTATVPILPMIGASIMSKKIAGGADALVLDVKTGSGAFMKREEDAIALADLLVRIGSAFGLKTSGFITDMGDPLGTAVGNWLEVVEVVDCLQGRPTPDLMEVTSTLAGEMIYRGGGASSLAEGIARANETISSGGAWKKFVEMVTSQHGDKSYIEETMRYPMAEHIRHVAAPIDGHVTSIDSKELGMLAIELGAGRKAITDRIDPTAGIVIRKKAGAEVKRGETLCELHSTVVANPELFAERAMHAWKIEDRAVPASSRILYVFDDGGMIPWI